MAGGSGEKTEKATPRKLKQARRDGSIGHSPELGSWLSVLVATFVLPSAASSLLSISRTLLVQVGVTIQDPDVGQAMGTTKWALLHAAMAVAPLALLVLLTSVVSAGGQGGIYFAPKLLKPKADRLNPLKGIKRMFGGHGAWQLVKSLLKLAVLALVTYLSVRPLIPQLVGSGSLPLQAVLATATDSALKLIRFGAVAGLLMSIADVVVVRRRNNKQTKMTKQEVKEEHKSNEGDPHLKGAIRSRAIAISRNRMMADVPNADVVVVNPTHIAIALKYDPTKGAPRVVAKGGDHMAARIRSVAEKHRVPMVQDIPLAWTLYETCEIGHEIPADLYQGVATVLAFIMRLKRKGSVAGMHRLQHA